VEEVAMTWSAKKLFEAAGVLFLIALWLQALLDISTVSRTSEMLHGTFLPNRTSLTVTVWYQGVFEPALIGVVGLLVGMALGRVAEAVAASREGARPSATE